MLRGKAVRLMEDEKCLTAFVCLYRAVSTVPSSVPSTCTCIDPLPHLPWRDHHLFMPNPKNFIGFDLPMLAHEHLSSAANGCVGEWEVGDEPTER